MTQKITPKSVVSAAEPSRGDAGALDAGGVVHASRRKALLLGAGLPLGLALPASSLAQEAAGGGGDGQGAPAPTGLALMTITLGPIAITPLPAGGGPSDDPIAIFGLEVDPAEFARVAEENFIPADKTFGSYTPVLVRMPDVLALFDAGMDPEGIVAALALVGVTPEQITHVVLTHMHRDHIGGLYGEGPTFPNAELIVPESENAYWAAQDNDAYKAKVAPLIDKARLIAAGDEILPGITAEAAYGHTPGHTIYLLEGDGRRLLLTADSFNHYAFSVGRPEWKVRYDNDKEAAIATRKAVLARLAAERIPFIGYHMPFPAVGFIAAAGEDSYRFVPASYQFRL